jgi:hypothetical protein
MEHKRAPPRGGPISANPYDFKGLAQSQREDECKEMATSRKRFRISVKDILDWKVYDVWISDWWIVVARQLNGRD